MDKATPSADALLTRLISPFWELAGSLMAINPRRSPARAVGCAGLHGLGGHQPASLDPSVPSHATNLLAIGLPGRSKTWSGPTKRNDAPA